MNKCFFIGKIIKNNGFKFILNKKNKSKIEMKIKLADENILKIIAYDEKADFIFRNNFNLNDIVFVQGKLRKKDKELVIIINYIEKVGKK